MKINNVFFIFLMLATLSCSKDDSNEPSAIMNVERDGVAYEITTFDNTLVSFENSNESGRILELRVRIDGRELLLSVTNWDWQNPPENGVLSKTYDTNIRNILSNSNSECLDIGGATICDEGMATYISGGVLFISKNVDNEAEGKLIITANDTANRTVSGSFDLVVQEFGFGANRTKITFKGTFTNLPYRL